MNDSLTAICQRVQVNIPYAMLRDGYLELFLERRLNPEIGLDAAVLEGAPRRQMRETADIFLDHQRSITLHGPFEDLNPGSRDPAIRDVTRRRLQRLIEVVPLFRPVVVVCHGGYDARRHGYFREQWLEQSLDMWSWAASEIRAAGSRLMLENVYEQAPSDLLALVEPLSSLAVGCCLDAGHLAAFAGAGLDDWLPHVAHCIGQCHLHDNRGRMDAHQALGDGAIDFNPLWTFLARTDRRPVITLEPHCEQDLFTSLAYLASRLPANQL